MGLKTFFQRPQSIGIWLLATVSCAHRLSREDQMQSQVHFDIGVSHFQDRKYPEALEEFQKAQKIDPQNASIKMHIGLAYLKLEKPETALQHVQPACSMKTPFPECWNNLSYIYLRLGRPQEAQNAAQKALTTDTYSTPDLALENLARAQIELKQFKEAHEALSRGLKLQPESCNLRLAAVLLAARENHFSQALGRAERTVDVCPQRPLAYFWKAYTYARLGRSGEAREIYLAILDRFPEAPVMDAARIALTRLKKHQLISEPSPSLGDL